MAGAHSIDAVVFQKGQQQLHFAGQCVFFIGRQVALLDDLLDFFPHGKELCVFVEKKQDKGQWYHGRRVFPLNFKRRMLQNIQDHGLGIFIDHICNFVTGEGHGENFFPCAGKVVEAQGIYPVPGLFCQLSSGKIDFFLLCFRKQ